MNLYEINQQIMELVDPETGELIDFEAFEALQMQRNEKIENLVLWVKDLNAEAAAIKTEINALSERQKATVKKAESVKSFLQDVLNGDKFKTARCSVSYRKSKSVSVDDDFIEWAKENADDLLTYKEPTASLTAIKVAISSGRAVEHAVINENNNIVIK